MTWRYELHGWQRMTTPAVPAPGFAMRPGIRTIPLRLRVTLYTGLTIGATLWLAALLTRTPHPGHFTVGAPAGQPAPDDARLARDIAALEKHLPPSTVQKINQRHAAVEQRSMRLAAHQRHVNTAIRSAAAILVAVLAWLGIGAPLSALWNRLVLTSPGPGFLKLTSTGLLRKTRTLRLADYAAPLLEQYELTRMTRFGTTSSYTVRRWAWVLVLTPAPGTDLPRVEFWLRSLRQRASRTDLPQEELMEFVRPLERLIAPFDPPTVPLEQAPQ